MNIDTRSRRAGKCFKDKVVFAHGEKMVTIRVNVCVSEAAGNPTSISLNPISTSNLKNSSFSSRLIGIINA